MPAIGEWWVSLNTGVTYQVTHVFERRETLRFSEGQPIHGKLGDTLLSSMENLSRRLIVPHEDLVRHYLCIKRKSSHLQPTYGAAMSEQETNERVTLLEVSQARLEERDQHQNEMMEDIREDVAEVKAAVGRITSDLSRARGLVFGVVITISALFNMIVLSWDYVKKKWGI